MRMKFFASLIFLSVIIFSSTAFGADTPVLVTQPAYHSMSFHVHKPAGLPNEFYVTYDGYLVYQGADKIWYYGSAENSGITKTGYVVGSVIPSVVNLKAWTPRTSSVAPVLGTDRIDTTPANTTTGQRIYTPPSSPEGTIVNRPEENSPNNPDWTHNSNFTAISRWQKSVDKIGVLSRPAIPVAWKGDYPEVIYAWTGLRWKQVTARGNARALNTIRREIYDLTVETNRTNILHWTDEDTFILSQYSALWGYEWLGIIMTGRN